MHVCVCLCVFMQSSWCFVLPSSSYQANVLAEEEKAVAVAKADKKKGKGRGTSDTIASMPHFQSFFILLCACVHFTGKKASQFVAPLSRLPPITPVVITNLIRLLPVPSSGPATATSGGVRPSLISVDACNVTISPDAKQVRVISFGPRIELFGYLKTVVEQTTKCELVCYVGVHRMFACTIASSGLAAAPYRTV